MQLSGLGVDIAGQDVVQHHILDEVGLVELFIVILLDALQADGQHRRELTGGLVRALHEDSIVVVLGAGELLIGVAIPHKTVARCQALRHKAFAHFSDQVQLRAGDHCTGLIHHADHTVDCVFHLVDHALEYSIGHKWIPLFLFCASRRGEIVIFNNFAALHYLFYTKEFTFATYFTKKFLFFLLKLSFRGLTRPKKRLFAWFLSVFYREIVMFF